MNSAPVRVTVWGENVRERHDERAHNVYPDGMHETIAGAIREHLGDDAVVGTATLDQPEHGLPEDVLRRTDVLTWWGHSAHEEVADAVVARVRDRVLAGMGLLVLHSGHYSRVFRALMGTSCTLRWREADDRELVWTVSPGHPIATGIPHPVVIQRQEMYGEPFDIPQPDELVFISSFSGGEVFRSGCCFTRGLGRIFYFSPGHETYPVYHHPDVRRILSNSVRWAYNPSLGGRESGPPQNEESPSGWFETRTATNVP